MKENPWRDKEGQFSTEANDADGIPEHSSLSVTNEDRKKFGASVYDWVLATTSRIYRDKGIGHSFFVPDADMKPVIDAAVDEYLTAAYDDNSIFNDEREIQRIVLAPVISAAITIGLRGSKYSGFGPRSVLNAFKKRPESDDPEFLRLGRQWYKQAKNK